MNIKFKYWFFFNLLAFTSNAQDNLVYTGLLIDSATQKPIPYAYIKFGESVSVSNQHGNFSIKYSAGVTKAIVTFSCIGYKSKELELSVLLQRAETYLSQDVKTLKEIVISQLTAQAILKKSEKRGIKNYATPKYSADYTFDQFIFFENADSSIANSRETGVFINRGLDTTTNYPKFTKKNRKISPRFLEFDTIPSQLIALTKQRNSTTVESAYSFDPLRIGLLNQFHAVPALFSKGFYDNTDLSILSIVTFNEKKHYLISIYPKIEKKENSLSNEESRQIALYKERIKEMAARSGRTISNKELDSILSSRKANPISVSTVTAFLLVDVKTYGIIHALIKLNTFDQTGKLYARLHVSASYLEYGKSYYLQNIDILMKKNSPDYNKAVNLYYLLSVNLSNFQIKKSFRSSFVNDPSVGLAPLQEKPITNLRLKDIEQFLTPVKDCVSCMINPLILFGQRVD